VTWKKYFGKKILVHLLLKKRRRERERVKDENES
jgi:hypothetical protein